jgi:hypothetical protein
MPMWKFKSPEAAVEIQATLPDGDAAQESSSGAMSDTVRRSAEAAKALSKFRDGAVPAVAGLAGYGRDYAVQKGTQAKELLAPQVSVLKQTAAKQRDDLAPMIEDWTGQARDRISDLSAQARAEVLPAIAVLVDQTRGRVEQLSGQARDQLLPAAVDFATQSRDQLLPAAVDLAAQAREQLLPAAATLAAQARDRAVQLGGQTRDTATSLQASAGDLVPAVTGAATGTATAVGGALDATGRAVRSTVNGLVWLTVLTGIAVFLYAPKDEERAKLLAEVQEWLSYAVDIVTELRGGE